MAKRKKPNPDDVYRNNCATDCQVSRCCFHACGDILQLLRCLGENCHDRRDSSGQFEVGQGNSANYSWQNSPGRTQL